MEVKIIVDENVLREAMRLFAYSHLGVSSTAEIRIDLGGDGIIATLKLEDKK